MIPVISIIVPVYNVEKYLSQCIDSILAQAFIDFELLLVDDGSTDGSGRICDEYANKDARIQVFHKKNGGVSSARNIGLEHAQGEWITFVDSDDWLDLKYCQILWEEVQDVDCFFSRCRYIIKMEESKFDILVENIAMIMIPFKKKYCY